MKQKKELNYEGINIVFDNEQKKLDNKRLLMVNMFQLYANFIERDIKVIFFHGQTNEEGISCYFRREK